MADGKVIIDTGLNTSGFEKDVKNLPGKMGGITSSLKGIATAAAAAFSVKAIVDFGKSAIELGSNIAEVQNVVDTAFGDMAYKAEAFADTSIEQFGMSTLSAKKTASTYMAMAKGMGLADGVASDMAISLAGLTGDVASFYNISQELADTKLKSVFTGETETLKDLGIVMTQTNLKAYAMQKGITKSLESMSQAELVGLRYSYVMDNLSMAQGDFAKTSGSWANQTRILSENWKEFMSVVGQGIIQVLTPLIRILNQIMSGAVGIIKGITSISGAQSDGKNEQKQAEAIEKSAQAEGELADNIVAAGKAAKNAQSSIDELNVLSSDESSQSSIVPVSTGAGGITNVFAQEPDTSGMQSAIDDVGKMFSKLWKSPFMLWIRGKASDASDFFSQEFKDFRVWLSDIWERLKGIGESAGPVLDKIGAFLKPIADAAWETFKSVLSGIWDIGQGLWTTALDIYDSFLNCYNAILSVLDSIGLLDMWSNQIANIIGFVKGIFSSAVEWIKGKLDVIRSIFSGFLDFFTGVFSGDWSKAWDGIKSIFDGVKQNFQNGVNFIKNIFGNVGTFLLNTFKNAWDGIKGVFSGVGNFFSNVWSGIKNAFGNVAGWFKNIFSVAWQKVKDVFSSGGKVFDGIKDGILTAFKTVVNTLIRGINTVIKIPFDGINFALKKIKDISILGAKPFDFINTLSVPQIPYLAQGAVIPPNKEFLAVLGDQRSGNNIEAPESLLRKLIGEEIGGTAIIALLERLITIVDGKETNLTVNIGDREVAQAANRGNKSLGYAIER